MQLRSLFLNVALCTITAWGCGPNVSTSDDPESWMRGWFSLRHPSNNVTETFDLQLYLNDDGSAVLREVFDCGSSELTFDMQWEAVDEKTASITGEDDTGRDQAYLLRKLEEGCNAFELARLSEDGSGAEEEVESMHAGQICMRRGEEDPDCIGSGCAVCYKTWCENEEPSAACENDEG